MVSAISRHVDADRIERAIDAAEQHTSGVIRVSIARPFWGSVRKAAERAFVHLGMTGTHQRNGMLIFVVPSRREFVILGDSALHDKVGQAFWEDVARAMSARIRSGHLTDGIVHGIEAAGRSLAEHFPRTGPTERD